MSTTTANTKDKEDLSQFTAEFTCASAVNGVINVNITNIDALWDKCEYISGGDEMMELVYRSIPTIEDSHKSIDKMWRVKDMVIMNVANNGDFSVRVPVYLHSYNFEFGIKTKDTSTNQWWPRSDTKTVTVPSFSSDTTYSVGDIVNFRNPLNCRVSEGKIIEQLNHGNYKILYKRYNADNEESKEYELSINISKISRKGIEQLREQIMIETCDDTAMIKHLLIKRYDEESMNIFDAIKTHYELSTQQYCFDIYGNEEFMFHWESMADFVTKNIFDYLFYPQFCYKIDCLIDGNHGLLELSNLRQKDIKNDYDMIRNGMDNIQIDIDSFDYIEYGCDWCRCLLTEWNYIYSCFAKDWDHRHDICLLCTYSIIQLNQQLAELLSDVLEDNLNIDCIQTIVNYVIGRVIYTEFNHDDDNDNDKDRKRKLEDNKIPNAKRRKLNDSSHI